MSPAAASASAHTTSAANGKNSSDSLLNVVDAVAPSIAARIAKKPRGCTTAIGATPRLDEWAGSLFSYFSLFLLFLFLISIMHIGSHSVIPVIWFSAVCVFSFLLIIYPCMAFQEPGGVSFSPEDTFCMSSIILQSFLVLFFLFGLPMPCLFY